MSLWDSVKGGLQRWDARRARQELISFEASSGRGHREGLRSGDLADLAAALRRHERLVLEHHWRTTDRHAAAQLGAVARAERAGADGLAICHDAVGQDPSALGRITDRVERFIRQHGVALPVFLLAAGAGAGESPLLPSKGPPFTRLVDADGGVLKVWPGGMGEGDVPDAVLVIEVNQRR